jgi:outer membrane protein assembly factor BamB
MFVSGRRLLVAILICIAVGVGFAAQRPDARFEWPQWRGATRDGTSPETGLLTQWPQQGPPLVFSATGCGNGFSSVAIAGGRIYTAGNRAPKPGEQTQLCVVALDLNDGKELWARPIAPEYEHNRGDGPRSTPTVDGDLLFIVSPQGNVVCLECADGEEVWRRSMQSDFGGKMMSGWGYSESPLVDGDKLICTPGGRDAVMVALNKRTGDEIWRCAMPNPRDLGERGVEGAGYASAVISEACGVRQYVQQIGKGLIGVDAQSGQFLWSYNGAAGKTANVPDAVIDGDFVFGSSGYSPGGSGLVKLTKTAGGIDAQQVYFLAEGEFRNHHGGLVKVGDYVYGGHGQNQGFPTCVELKTGKLMWERERPPSGANGSAAIIYADGHLYFRYQSATMVLIKADPNNYQVVGTFRIPQDERVESWSHPVICDGKLYLREQDKLHVYDLRKS